LGSRYGNNPSLGNISPDATDSLLIPGCETDRHVRKGGHQRRRVSRLTEHSGPGNGTSDETGAGYSENGRILDSIPSLTLALNDEDVLSPPKPPPNPTPQTRCQVGKFLECLVNRNRSVAGSLNGHPEVND
jgi:hypothetical protein